MLTLETALDADPAQEREHVPGARGVKQITSPETARLEALLILLPER